MSAQFQQKYPELIRKIISAEQFDDHPESIYAIDPDGHLIYVNAGWHRFAETNGGQPQIADSWGIGANYFAAVPESLESFYRHLFRQAPEYGAGVSPLTHCYQCSTPTLYREYNMLVYALPERAGYLVVNSLVIEAPHDPQVQHPRSPDRARYTDGRGFVHQCAHCRRFQCQGREVRWDWVPAWVRQPPERTSHGICPVCADYYFPPASR